MFSSTEMLEHWRDKVLPMLKEKDYRDDAERMAYNAYLEGCFFGGSKAMWHEDTDDESLLPPYDEEVIALVAQKAESGETIGYRIGFAHRPAPSGWDGKSVTTGKVTHYEPKLYGKGGWNGEISLWMKQPPLPKEYIVY